MKRRFRISFVLLAGILLLGIGLIGLSTVPDVMQYAFLPSADTSLSEPPVTEQGEETADYSGSTGSSMLAQYDEAMKNMATFFPKLTVHGVRTEGMLKNGTVMQSDVCLYATGPNWNEVYPQRFLNGRPILRHDAEKQSRVIVLDEATILRFFGNTDTEDRAVELDGEMFEVVGVSAHSRAIGESGEHAAWVPLDTIKGCSQVVVSVPAKTLDYFTMFETLARSNFGKDGTAFSMVKEKFRAILPLLVVFVAAAVWLLGRWFRRLAGFWRIRLEKVKAESKRRYAGKLIPYAAGQLLPMALLTVLSVGVCYGVAVLAISPMTFFPEWIPDVLGEYTSWVSLFWRLTGDAAKPVTMNTAELVQVHLWGSLILWGTLLILLRAAKKTLAGFGKKNTED